MTAGPYRPQASISPGAINSESLTTLLKVAGLAGLAGAGVLAADQLLLRSRASHPWHQQKQDQALRPSNRQAIRPSTPITATAPAAPQRLPNAAELSQPTPLPTVTVAQPARLSNPRSETTAQPRDTSIATAPSTPAAITATASPRGAMSSTPRRSSAPSFAPAVASAPPAALPVPPAKPPISASTSSAANSTEQVATIKKPSFSRFFNPPDTPPQAGQSTVAEAQTEVVPTIVARVLNSPSIQPNISPDSAQLAQSTEAIATLPPSSDSRFTAPRAIPLPVLSPSPESFSPSPTASTKPTSTIAASPNTAENLPRPTALSTGPDTELLTEIAQTQEPDSSFSSDIPSPATPSRQLVSIADLPAESPPPTPAAATVLPPAEPVAINPSLEAAAVSKVRFVEEFEVTGSSVYGAEELAIAARNAVVTPSNSTANATTNEQATSLEEGEEAQTTDVNRELSAAELVLASEAITNRYVEDGYINSGAYIPEAVLEGGPAEIRVIEGSLDAINVNVEPPRKAFSLGRSLQPGYVERRLARATEAPLNINKLVDGVRLLELDPVIESVSTELLPGTDTGTSTLKVTVLPAKPFEASISVDNSRSPSVGSVQQQLNVSQANLLGVGDRLNVGVSRSSGSNSVNLGYSIPVNARNGTLGLNFSRSSSTVVEAPFDDLDIESKARTYEVSYRQPIIQTPNEELGLSLKAFRRASEGFFLDGATPFPSRGSDEDGRTRIAALRFGQDWTKRHPKQVLALQSEFSLGLGLFDATVNSNSESSQPDGRFFAWRGRGQWVRRLGSDVLLSVKGDAQLAANPLLSSEQFGLGGVGTVRGYRSNSLLTDSGWLASAEVQVPVVRIPKWNSTIKLAPFLDMGGGWNLGEQENPDPSRLMSTGVGVLWDMGDRFRARLDWGFPLTSIERDGESLQEKGINFSVLWNAF